jgi:pimeloyl-ACP methyl ester carboxylesterase
MRVRVNGIQMAYTDEGEGACLLLVHGFPLSRGAWSKQVAAFKTEYRVVAPDLRGFGETAGTPGVVPMGRFAEDLHALAVHLATGPVILVGHSMGGFVALAFAKAYPGIVRALALVSTKAGPDSPEAADARRALAERVRREGAVVVINAMAPKMLSDANRDRAMAAATRGLMAPLDPEAAIGALLGMAERPDDRPWLAKLRLPVLVIAGLDDALIPPSESLAMAKAIPGAQLRLIPGAGHLVAFEQPEAFNAALWDWPERRRGFRPAG